MPRDLECVMLVVVRKGGQGYGKREGSVPGSRETLMGDGRGREGRGVAPVARGFGKGVMSDS